MGPQGQIKLWKAVLLLQSWKLVNDRRRRKSGRPGEATWQIYSSGVKTYWNMHVTSPCYTSDSSNFEEQLPRNAHTPTCKGWCPECRGGHIPPRVQTAMSACHSWHFNCYISALIWAKREASTKLGTSKATSPSLTSCLSLWWRTGFGESGKAIGKAVWILSWNGFDGLIVAPSGHRRTSQKTCIVGEWWWGRSTSWGWRPAEVKFFPRNFSLSGSLCLALCSFSCIWTTFASKCIY